ncbi:MAG: hypothetical protein V1647_01400 [Pseudomonadota bacterium]
MNRRIILLIALLAASTAWGEVIELQNRPCPSYVVGNIYCRNSKTINCVKIVSTEETSMFGSCEITYKICDKNGVIDEGAEPKKSNETLFLLDYTRKSVIEEREKTEKKTF